MKQLMYSRPKRTVLLILIYLAAMALSICAIVIYPLSRQKTFYIRHAGQVAESYLEGERELPLWMDGRTRVAVFDVNGGSLYDASTDEAFMMRIDCIGLVQRICNGEKVFSLRTAEGTSLITEGLYGVAGVPVVQNGQIIGAAFYIRKIIAILESALCFGILFSIMYWISAYYVVSSIMKQKRMDEERQIYVDNFTHALKTPVASVKVLAEALCDGVVTDPLKLQSYYGIILNETTKQSKMIQQILDLSKLQSNRTDMGKAEVNVRDLFGPDIERYAKLADLVDITMHVDEEIYELPALFTNQNGIREVMRILLDNALKYVPEEHNIWIDAKNDKRCVTFCVRDDGNGIPEENLPHIFDRFYKGKNTGNADSSGLGLAIAKEITELLGEKIWAANVPGGGAEFCFTVKHR